MSMRPPELVDRSLAVLQLVEHELLIFAASWLIVSALDEIAIDSCWLWLKLTGKLRERRLRPGDEARPLRGSLAVLVPAWREASVIGDMIRHTLKVWPHERLTLYVGCYRNDPETIAAAMAGAGEDARLRVVIHDRDGPTTKADCLNRLYAALAADELRSGRSCSGVVLHDAEDMVHPAALSVIDEALVEVDFVQLPVRPEPQPASPWVAGHYSDEFTEAHAKSLVVRDALGAAIPAAGVGCGFSRTALADLAHQRAAAGQDGPFASECLTEDYELGIQVSQVRARGRFVRLHDHFGDLVATRAFFPAALEPSIRQKARWIHGIALQGWDRLGWGGRLVDVWMALRDRRGPLTAIVLAAAYLLILVELILASARIVGWQDALVMTPLLKTMIVICFASLIWRGVWRFYFTGREYGIGEGIRSLLRVPVANVISILAGRRALHAYIRTLRGEAVYWDKTEHSDHPAAPDRHKGERRK